MLNHVSIISYLINKILKWKKYGYQYLGDRRVGQDVQVGVALGCRQKVGCVGWGAAPISQRHGGNGEPCEGACENGSDISLIYQGDLTVHLFSNSEIGTTQSNSPIWLGPLGSMVGYPSSSPALRNPSVIGTTRGSCATFKGPEVPYREADEEWEWVKKR